LKYANCSEEETNAAVDHIISQSKRIQNISNKLMALACMGDETIEMLPVKLADIIPDIEAALHPTIQDKRIEIHKNLQPITINGDAELLKSLLINVIDNAIKASDEASIIEIHADNASITIIDHGKGMEHDEIDKITESFYRVDQSRSRNEGGAGLGLALCTRICEVHNASLQIISAPGQGTTVKILFTTL